MRHQAPLIRILCVIVVIAAACGQPDTAARKLAIEKSLNETLPGVLEIPTGSSVRTTDSILPFLNMAEAGGLVNVRRPSSLPNYLVQVVATQKLLDVAIDPNSAYSEKDAAEDLGGETR